MDGHKLPSQSLLKRQTLKCPDCKYATSYPNALQVHKLKEHAKDDKPKKPYKCGICSYETSFRSNLQKHQRIHTGEKPYVCACCCMRFSFRSNHKRHEQRCISVRGGSGCQDTTCGFSGGSPNFLPLLSNNYQQPSRPAMPKPDAYAMDSERNHYSLTLDQFVLQQDATQRAMLDLYYKAFNSSVLPSETQANLNRTHLPTSAGTEFLDTNLDEKIKVKEEPIDFPPISPSCAEREEIGAVIAGKGRTYCMRKQINPRRTQTNWSQPSLSNPDHEDTKPNIAMLQQDDLPKSMAERNRLINQLNLHIDTKDLKPSIRINTVNTAPEHSQCSLENLSSVSIKMEGATSPHLSPSVHVKRARSRSPICGRLRHSTTSTSATPSSVADAETTLPFTLDAVLGELSLGNLIDMLVQNGRIYRCHHCKILFEEYATYVLHMGCHGSTNPFSCHFCGVGFHEKFGFLTHFMKCLGK